jgi:hypothetical protein
MRDHAPVIPTRRETVLPGLIAALLVTACGAAPSAPPSAPVTPQALTSVAQAPSGALTASPPVAVPSPGFVFDPESIAGYFESIGYACTTRVPSRTAIGDAFQSCQLVDSEGRTRTVGIVTDSADNVADAFMSVRGTTTEPVLDPVAVLDPFAAFLGAFLGVEEGTAQLPWLAAHLGDADSRTTAGDLTIATYTPTPDDHTKLTVEVATLAYLDPPAPSPG